MTLDAWAVAIIVVVWGGCFLAAVVIAKKAIRARDAAQDETIRQMNDHLATLRKMRGDG